MVAPILEREMVNTYMTFGVQLANNAKNNMLKTLQAYAMLMWKYYWNSFSFWSEPFSPTGATHTWQKFVYQFPSL